ncbi:hypothetical protein LTS08_002382 [Lithohypha guttulata]|nr:hypothetical protein LTS08_002382 [Lithohypha guttulata]
MDNHEQKIVAPSTTAILTHHKLTTTDTSATTLAVGATFSKAVSSDITVKCGAVDEKSSSHTTSLLTDLEKQDEHVPRSNLYSWLRWTALNTYRRLFSIVFTANLIAFIVVWVQHRKLLNFIDAAAANLLVCGLARQPLVVNAFYTVACLIPKSAPLRLRTLAAKVFHFGGVHSGCGVASAVWYITFVGVLTYQYVHGILPHTAANMAVLVLAYLVMCLLCGIIVAAYPSLRSRYHDAFERVHRFSGWAVVLMFWPLLLTFSSAQQNSMGQFLIRQPTFWILLILTLAIIQPWTKLRRVKVTPEKLSSHAIRLHFDFANPKLGQGISISQHPLRDWHSFASFTDKYDTPDSKFSLVVSKAGDFTGDIIANPPQHVWKRSVPLYGFGKVMTLYSRMILVTTGSGIGPCLSFLFDLDAAPTMRVLWQTRTPEQTYGQRVIDLVHKMDPDPVILDTTKGGRIDMLPLVIKMYHEFEAEAVCVISNPKMTKHLVYELERRGILAAGPIFDS